MAKKKDVTVVKADTDVANQQAVEEVSTTESEPTQADTNAESNAELLEESDVEESDVEESDVEESDVEESDVEESVAPLDVATDDVATDDVATDSSPEVEDAQKVSDETKQTASVEVQNVQQLSQVDYVPSNKYIPVVDSFSAGNVVGFVTVADVVKFVKATRAGVVNIGNFGAVACNYKDRIIGVLGCVEIMGKRVPAIDCVTTAHQTNMGCFEDFRTVTEELSGHKYTRMMEFSDFE